MIVLIGGEKGGTGKTTILTNLAAKLALNGKDVIIVDADKQASASGWILDRKEAGYEPRISCIQKFGATIADQLQDLASRYEYVLVDSGGQDSLEQRYILSVCDIVLIPFRPSQYDVNTLVRMDEIILRIKSTNKLLKAFAIINNASTHPFRKEIKDVRKALIELKTITISDNVIKDRIAFQNTAKTGRSIYEFKESDQKAIDELDSIYNEFFMEKKYA